MKRALEYAKSARRDISYEDTLKEARDKAAVIIKQAQLEAIEECANVAQNFKAPNHLEDLEDIFIYLAAEIRKLKESVGKEIK